MITPLDFMLLGAGVFAFILAALGALFLFEETYNFFKYRFQKPDWIQIVTQKNRNKRESTETI